MWPFEKKLPIRGVKFYFLIKPEPTKEEKQSLTNQITLSPELSKYYEYINVKFFKSIWLHEWTQVKIFCAISNHTILPSKTENFYLGLFDNFTKEFIQLVGKTAKQCILLDLRILFKIYPKELTDEFVPIASLDKLRTKVMSPPDKLLPPPKTVDAMIAFAKKNKIIAPIFKELMQVNKEHDSTLYASYGIHNFEYKSNTQEADTIL